MGTEKDGVRFFKRSCLGTSCIWRMPVPVRTPWQQCLMHVSCPEKHARAACCCAVFERHVWARRSKDWQWPRYQCIQSISSKRENKKEKGQVKAWTHLVFWSRMLLYPANHLSWYCDLQDLLLAGHYAKISHWVYKRCDTVANTHGVIVGVQLFYFTISREQNE